MANDLISRDDVCKTLYDNCHIKIMSGNNWIRLEEAIAKLTELPSADVRENVRGEWKKEIRHYKGNDQEYDYYVIKCSQCGARPQKAWELTNFCPNCGARMEVEE